jgi:Fur family transcriptional regulator, ferric uptake regulator
LPTILGKAENSRLHQCWESGTLQFMAAKTRLRREEDLKDLLVQKGLRVTDHRMTILRELAKLRIPTSHPELAERLASSEMDRATVYRNLLSLTEAGLLVKTQLGDNVWRFELPTEAAAQHGSHPHFVCTDCGNIRCLPTNSVSFKGEAAEAQIAEVQLRGLCADCRD